ncbi:sigma-E factor negative regulatory protein [Ursidibacter maritimus]|uniref:Anti-sigma-E factor RseA n=1 Tax=Ursidibacter maritimus TaxID=1331689 RepID=A0A949WMQ2_9PAST|nr:sigma-E factor negative regulatory protein [Ursidibacter maritimus]KAE9538277.1 transcriptional regulator [Ursidibacter maritimus]MBV6524544.1 sigma-E factor negative regulatory protein [Ursidibacter maritimus]MBV6525580.1 sigma-E factor negative regulatory protein [Ursidibacter maritimus]MBV6527666.1 sigma-E factor negative regulatory protein [Ursidibacter maritimus]MBV6529573.1 sigma-E factor negative regulatory protein [Ursidibacter maritimus]
MQQRETLSAYMDGHNVNGEFTDTLCKSEELQKKWASYHAVRSVMRGEDILLGNDFSAKMEALLENEEIEKSAESVKPKGLLLKLKRWGAPLMQAGIAASVCLMAVIGFNTFNNGEEVATTEQPTLQTLPFTNSVQQVSYNAPAKDQPTEQQLEYQQRRINALLQNHELQRRTSAGTVVLSEEEKSKAQTSSTETNKNE